MDNLPADLEFYIREGLATVVHWHSLAFCEEQKHERANDAHRLPEECAMDVHTQQWVRFLSRFVFVLFLFVLFLFVCRNGVCVACGVLADCDGFECVRCG
jgi:hypothetical protein